MIVEFCLNFLAWTWVFRVDLLTRELLPNFRLGYDCTLAKSPGEQRDALGVLR
jgi:hypothetical protein